MRPSLPEIAEQRALAMKLLAENPRHELAPMLRVFLGATAPPTKEEALPVMIANANTIGNWSPIVDDMENAKAAIEGRHSHPWGANIRAQWATLRHFFGGAG